MLFSIATDRVRLVWSGPPALPDATAPPGRLTVETLRAGAAAQVEGGLSLRLAEQTRYHVFVTSGTGEPVELRHRDPVVLGGLRYEDEGRIAAGPVDFGGQVGQSRFAVAVGGVEELAFEVEVGPTKLSHGEVERMRAEIDEALAGLGFEYLRATQTAAAEGTSVPGRATWLTLLRRALPNLEAALRHVAARPHRDLRREASPVRAERVQRPDASVLRAVRLGRGSGSGQRLHDGYPVRSVLPTRRADLTLDTPEHRWLRARLAAAQRALARLHADESGRSPSSRRLRLLADLTNAEDRLGQLLRLGPLAAARLGAPPLPTPRLVTAPGYAEAYTACRVLELSLVLADGPVPHATKDLGLLYELWSYLTVVRTVADLVGQPVPAAAFFRAEHRGVRLLLRRGRRHGVAFESEGRTVRLAYNPRFSARAGLLAQRPDILLTVEAARQRQRYVLDAKYRRDDRPGYARRFGAPGPPEEALGALHRYRDAIVGSSGERTIAEAVALYPFGADEGFAESRLWTSTERIGVGAVPLVPGATGWLERWLRRVLGEQAEG